MRIEITIFLSNDHSIHRNRNIHTDIQMPFENINASLMLHRVWVHYILEILLLLPCSTCKRQILSHSHSYTPIPTAWWRHQMGTFSALLAFCAENSPVTGEFPSQRPVTRGFGVFLDLCLNKSLSKQSWGWWFETPSCSLWRHCNE